jgi:hypothetical protein
MTLDLLSYPLDVAVGVGVGGGTDDAIRSARSALKSSLPVAWHVLQVWSE